MPCGFWEPLNGQHIQTHGTVRPLVHILFPLLFSVPNTANPFAPHTSILSQVPAALSLAGAGTGPAGPGGRSAGFGADQGCSNPAVFRPCKPCDPRQVTSPLCASLWSLQSGEEDLIKRTHNKHGTHSHPANEN